MANTARSNRKCLKIINKTKQSSKHVLTFSIFLYFQLDRFLVAKGIHPDHGGKSFYITTDGPNHIRQVLHPECATKNITLPSYFSPYYDLRKEFRKFYKAENIVNIKSMLDCILFSLKMP